MSFEDDLDAPVERDWMNVSVTLNGSLYELRFTALDAFTWANLCDRAPWRDDVWFDKGYGYDIRSLTRLAAPVSGARMDGETAVELSAEQWETFFAKVDGNAFRRISDALWQLNEHDPLEAVKAAKKALAASAATSSSQSASVSPRKGSTAGSRKKSSATNATTLAG